MKIALLDEIKFRMKPLSLYCLQTCLEIHILSYMHTFFFLSAALKRQRVNLVQIEASQQLLISFNKTNTFYRYSL